MRTNVRSINTMTDVIKNHSKANFERPICFVEIGGSLDVMPRRQEKKKKIDGGDNHDFSQRNKETT